MGPWYHRVTVVEDIETPAKSKNILNKFKILEPHLPLDLKGAKVLDLGCNAGGMSIEFARRGAECVGFEATKHYHAQAEWLAEKTGLKSRLRFVNASIYRAAALRERFDIVLFMGLIYHLRYPQLALDICRSVCTGMMFLNTPVVVSPSPIMENRLRRGPEGGAFVPYSHESRHNWWYPSRGALEAMMLAAGFEDLKVIWSKDAAFASSSAQIDNASDFPTGSVYYFARAGSKPVLTPRQLLADISGDTV
jgi:tRNA (mo5U34)-methyltransferase